VNGISNSCQSPEGPAGFGYAL